MSTDGARAPLAPGPSAPGQRGGNLSAALPFSPLGIALTVLAACAADAADRDLTRPRPAAPSRLAPAYLPVASASPVAAAAPTAHVAIARHDTIVDPQVAAPPADPPVSQDPAGTQADEDPADVRAAEIRRSMERGSAP